MIADALRTLFRPGDVVELRAMKTHKGTISGYYDDMDKLAADAAMLDAVDDPKPIPGIYVTLNPCIPDVMARAANRLEYYARWATTDDEIAVRRWLFVDVDPKRPSGISATDAELEGARQVATRIEAALAARAWPRPVRAESGNGVHLLYPVAWPNDDAHRAANQLTLQAIAKAFATPDQLVDTGNFNAARVIKLYGTMARKGDPIPGRPHRRSCVIR